MRGGRRLDDAATSRAMLGQRATRARDTARFTALEYMIRELAPFPPSYDVSAGQDTGFAEWRYTDLLGGIYLSTQSTEINCRIMALAAVNRQRRPYALCRRLRAQPEDKYHLQDLPRPPARVVLLPGSNQLSWMVSREALSRLMFEHEEVMIKPHPLTTEADLRALGLHYGLDRILPRDASGVACVLAAGQLWHTTSSELGLLAMAHGKRVSNISDFRREAGGAFYPIYRHLWRRDDAAQALDELAAWEASGLLFLDMDDLEARIRAHYRLAMQLRAELRPLAAPFLPPQEAE